MPRRTGRAGPGGPAGGNDVDALIT